MKIKFVVLVIVLLLSGCTYYEASDTSQYYYMLRDNIGTRVNQYGPELCASPDEITVYCIEMIPDRRLLDSWMVPELQDYFTIYKDAQGIFWLEFSNAKSVMLLFITQNQFYIMNDEVVQIEIITDGDKGLMKINDRMLEIHRIKLEPNM